jgi:hypothetical protein
MVEVHGGVEVLGHGRETRFVYLPSGCCGNQQRETIVVRANLRKGPDQSVASTYHSTHVHDDIRGVKINFLLKIVIFIINQVGSASISLFLY